ncbi:DNA-directed RNA polymerase precursor [Theileria orientalis strain Shintoku]|uniref:DNA-directed RNA polymerase n=1 Tax=Theileria orientalis strain Shintoku TaxID=869250 RepID=J4C7R0_THEOR|nr:DNA-directed RNA polymerase precursor [Theileria orientalis strain Shintoku]BAM39473.1 DNA-directed RNA polymerase precursor [Theileria orientalis strain Shintoku]|eukprot:XP_009689774.1 DNA-directed RNA polymerase precursor [Theileria orientalis strain Shintoku]
MVRTRVLNINTLDSLLYRNNKHVFVSNHSNINPQTTLSNNTHFDIGRNLCQKCNSLLIHKNFFKRNIYTSRICNKTLDSVNQDAPGITNTYFPGGSDITSPDSSLIDKYGSQLLDIRIDKQAALTLEPEAHLENVRSVVLKSAEEISMWLRTNRHSYIKDVDESVVQIFREAEKFASIHGLLLGDVSVEDLKSHVKSVKTLSSLFSTQFIRKQKKKLYKDNELPLLATQQTRSDVNEFESANGEDEGKAGYSETLNYKRQELIEKLSFSEALESAKVEASSLLDFKHPSELSSLSSTCSQWIEDISSFIKRDRDRGGNFVIPLDLDEEQLATTTVKVVLQSMCFPTYTFDSKGNKGGLFKKRIQQTTSNQVLISHLAIKLGDEIGKMYNVSSGVKVEGEERRELRTAENRNSNENDCDTNGVARDSEENYIEIRSAKVADKDKDNKVTVKSNLNAVMKHLDVDTTKKSWNSSQSAAVGGYLLNALIRSCKIELDLQTAMKQYLSNYSYYYSQSLHSGGAKRTGESSVSANKRSATVAQSAEDALVVSDGKDELHAFKGPVLEDKLSVTGGKISMRDSKLDLVMRFLSVIKKSRFNESLVEVEAFRHVLLRQGIKTFGVLEMRESCMLQLRDFVAKSLLSLAALPMVCRPKKWINATTGGSLLLKHNFIRGSKLNEVKVYDLEGVFDIVNRFSQVPWVINRDMLQIIKAINNDPNSIPMKQFVPITGNNGISGNNGVSGGADTKLNSDQLSELSLFLRRIKIADSFVNEKKLYVPLNIDFRGRMYPLSPYLNHMNDDLCRSLLLFSERRRMGERGLFWLKIHVSNMFGNDKKSFEERIRWVDEHYAIIADLTRNPWGDFNQNFWAKADKPFQFFAASLELVRAVESGDPANYRTNIPIQQDGTCNGLQHYAALGLDEEGARYVNMVDAAEPQDLYSHILQVVIKKVYQDLNSAAGDPGTDTGHAGKRKTDGKATLESNRRHAELCINNNLLSRKVVKQTVMTICYGVTRVGAIDQVEAKLKDVKKVAQLPEAELRGLATYLATKILTSITSVFSRAMGIKNWLDEISLLHNQHNVPVTWISPVGLPCEQPYCLSVTKTVKTPLQAINVARYVPGVDKRRQKLAFPPNFIHSLDAAHLMLTARRMFAHTQSFAAVHDNFWVHPDHVDLMHRCIREEFVAMHSRPILEDLHKSVVSRLQVPFRPPPSKGSLDLNLVLGSRYFFH